MHICFMKDSSLKKLPPPGRKKIIDALRVLLESKDFSSIKIADIAGTAGVTEPLIYKYFKDKRDVLHSLLQEYLEISLKNSTDELNKISGSINKLNHFIKYYVRSCDTDRVLARVVLLEVRNSYDYYESAPYHLFKKYGELILSIIQEGVKERELREDISPLAMRHLLFGSIDRACLNPVIFNTKFNVNAVIREMTTLIFDACRKR